MKIIGKLILVGLFSVMLCAGAMAQENDLGAPPGSAPEEPEAAFRTNDQIAGQHPRAPEDPFWAGPMVIIILGLFLAAAVVGPIIRSEMPEEVPVPHGHDEVVGHEDHGAHEPGHGH